MNENKVVFKNDSYYTFTRPKRLTIMNEQIQNVEKALFTISLHEYGMELHRCQPLSELKSKVPLS